MNPLPTLPNRTALPDDAWDADTRRVLARQDDTHDALTPDDYATLLADALATPAD